MAASDVRRVGSSSRLATVCEEGSEAVSRPLAIVWPCPLPVDAYVGAGRDVEVPRPVCPSCAGPLVFWWLLTVTAAVRVTLKKNLLDVHRV